MTVPKFPKPDEIGPWSEDKLDLLEKYLRAYSIIMNSQKEKGYFTKYHYIDAFAGAVVATAKNYDDPDITRFIEGSPLRALQVKPPFDVYWFIEMQAKRSTKLTELQADHSDRDIRVRKGDCNAILRNEVIPEVNRASKQRGVVFLDPYGLQVRWATMVALAQAGTFDVFVNFSTMGITRLLERNRKPDEKTRERISQVMGDSGWIDLLYSQSSSFLEAPATNRGVLRANWLADQYAKQVGTLFEHVSAPPLLMRNTRNAPIYSLFLASHNETAVKRIFNSVTEKYNREKSGQQLVKRKVGIPSNKDNPQDTLQRSFEFSEEDE